MCALGPESVVLTDMDEVTPLLEANILLNGVMTAATEATGRAEFSAAPLLWGTPLPSRILESCEAAARNGGLPAVVIASDVVYDPVGYAPLLHTLQSLLLPGDSDGGSCPLAEYAVLAQRHRNPEDYRFFDMVRDPSSKLRIEKITDGLAGGSDSWGVDALQDIEIYVIREDHPPEPLP